MFRVQTTLTGMPTAIIPGGMLSKTELRAPITEPWPMVMPCDKDVRRHPGLGLDGDPLLEWKRLKAGLVWSCAPVQIGALREDDAAARLDLTQRGEVDAVADLAVLADLEVPGDK